MKIVSDLLDARIQAHNLLVVITIGEYRDLVQGIISKNEFQRKRVRSSKSIYALLREDLLKQCIIPPIVLALTSNVYSEDEDDKEKLKHIIDEKENLVILDGLQRTHTILDLISELGHNDDQDTLHEFMSSEIRIEIYVGLNRLGILYRMLTLNTGQTPMSLRQQIEMLYLDYQQKDISGIELIRESDEKKATQIHQYNFKDIVEGFNAYLDRDELPIDKADILENINSLEKLSKENQDSELFELFVSSLNELVVTLDKGTGSLELTKDYIDEKGTPFGKDIIKIIKKPQAISGFGAAIGKLFDFKILNNFGDVTTIIHEITIEDPNALLEEINDSLLWLKNNSKKIGNAQRSYFCFLFRDLFNNESDSFKNPLEASKSALRKYQAQNM